MARTFEELAAEEAAKRGDPAFERAARLAQAQLAADAIRSARRVRLSPQDVAGLRGSTEAQAAAPLTAEEQRIVDANAEMVARAKMLAAKYGRPEIDAAPDPSAKMPTIDPGLGDITIDADTMAAMRPYTAPMATDELGRPVRVSPRRLDQMTDRAIEPPPEFAPLPIDGRPLDPATAGPIPGVQISRFGRPGRT